MIPKTVKICGIPYDIVMCEDNFDIDTHFGQIEYRDSIIKINKDVQEPMQKQTLCHEIVHGILVHIGYSDLSNDETFVQALAMAINQTFDVKGASDG